MCHVMNSCKLKRTKTWSLSRNFVSTFVVNAWKVAGCQEDYALEKLKKSNPAITVQLIRETTEKLALKFSHNLVCCVAWEWPERTDSTMLLFGFQELLKIADNSMNLHFNFRSPDTSTADTFSFTNLVALRCQTFQRTCTLMAWDLIRLLLIRSVSLTNSYYALRHFNEHAH